MSSISIIENLYRTFRDKDYDSFRALCSEDMEWIQNKGFPKGGHHYGADAVIKNVFQQFEKDWNYFKFQVEEMFESEDGSKVTVLGVYFGEHKQTGKTVEAAAAHIYEIKHSKVKRFRQFTDTALIQAATQA
jgi:ketosteroid isomerase-like protein